MFNRIHHPGYLVQNLDDTVAWYEKAFGGKVIGGGASGTGRNAFVQMGNAIVELIEPADKTAIAGKGGQVLDHIGYEVDDIEKAMEGFTAKGMSFAAGGIRTNVMGWKLIYFDTKDTQGTRIHITQAK